jgi:hydrogenase maturation protease
MSNPLILCLGSEIDSDDGFGAAVAAALHASPRGLHDAEIVHAYDGHHHLIELLRNRSRVLVVDVIVDPHADPGTLRHFPAGAPVVTRNLAPERGSLLPEALATGRALGYAMPESVEVLACVPQDLTSLRVGLTAPVEDAVRGAMDTIRAWARPVTAEMALS